MEPTKEQLQEFWELCGIHCHQGSMGLVYESWSDDGITCYYADDKLPPINLTTLDLYAVPKLFEMGYDYRLWSDDGYHFFYIYKRFHLDKPIFHSIGYVEAKDAVFATIYKALGGK